MNLKIMKPSEMTDKVPYVFCKDFIPMLESSVMMLFAMGGIGKSWLAIHAAIKLVSANPSKKAALWLTEDPEGENRRRFLYLIDTFGDKDVGFYNDRIHFIQSEPYRFTSMSDGNAVLTQEFKTIKNSLSNYNLIVLDPLLQFQGGEENSNTHAGVMMGGLKTWAAEQQKIILLIHHATFGNDMKSLKARGAREWINGTRGAYSIEKIKRPAAGATKEEVKNFYENVKISLVKDNGLSATLIKSYGSTTFEIKALPPM